MASILIVDPSKSNRLYLRLTLEKQGYQVFEAGNGLEALESYEHNRPNLVITEIKLPVLSGADLVQRIKLLAKETFAPVFVVTNVFKPDSIQRILSVGADDFLQKPYPEELLLAKIASLLRNVNFYDDLKQSKELVSSLHMGLALEHKSAERIFEKFVHGPRQEVPGLEAHVSPASIFNGDVFLSTITPAGNVITLLGDFTGHGLPAAIGAIPVAEVFYSMVKKGRTLKEIILVINDKLKTILPAHIFFSCVAVKVFPKRHSQVEKRRCLNPLRCRWGYWTVMSWMWSLLRLNLRERNTLFAIPMALLRR
jgi:CheY-like chemotaxis protein